MTIPRSSVIVENESGILLVAMKNDVFMLPGGGIESWESERDAAVRELYEETSLLPTSMKYLFNHENYFHDHFVFQAETLGTPAPSSEIERIAYYSPGSNLDISNGTRSILESYYSRG